MQYKFIVKSNALPGQEAEYERWYEEQHIPDVLKVYGIVAAQRFVFADEQVVPSPPTHRFLTIYDVETDDLAKTIADFKAQGRTMARSDAIDRASATMEFFAVAGPLARELGAA